MQPFCSRREFLTASATLAGGALLGTAGCSDETLAPLDVLDPAPARAASSDLSDPPVISSVGGTLAASIAIATTPLKIAGATRRQPLTYGHGFPGPTLWVNAGDQLDLTFRNQIKIGSTDENPGYGRPPRPDVTMTNVHFHGMHITPVGTGDNMLVMIESGASYRHQFALAADHPAGLFWYHPHVHGLVTNQLGRGGCGMLYVANAHTAAVSAAYRRRILVVQQLFLEEDLRTVTSDDGERDDPIKALTLLNGEQMPQLHLRPNERQVWSIANGSTSAFYQLHFPAGFAARVLAWDGLTRSGYPAATGPIVQLAPGKRVEIEVHAPGTVGSSVLSLDAYFQGVDTWPAKPLATLVVSGSALADTAPVPLDPGGFADLGSAAVAKRRTVIFDQDDSVEEGEFGRFRMYLQGTTPHSWNLAVPEWTDSVLGTVEEWTIVNGTAQEHPFHVHTNPFQVMSVTGSYNGAPAPLDLVTGFHDTVVVPPWGRAVVRTRFTDFPGAPILMHCHILDHEDMGMMTWFQIQPA